MNLLAPMNDTSAIAEGPFGAQPLQEENLPLLAAVVAGDLETVELLAPIEARKKNADGHTALMLAAFFGNAACVERLLPFSDIDAQDEHGECALSCAAGEGFAECVALLAPIADATLLNDRGRTPLMQAAVMGHADVIRVLARASDANLQGSHGYTALMWAVCDQQHACIEALLPASDAKIISDHGRMAIDLAAEREDWRAADLLAEKSPRDKAQAVFELAGPHAEENMPRWAAKLAAEELSAAIRLASKDKGKSESPHATPNIQGRKSRL